jgi:hypothetical protein
MDITIIEGLQIALYFFWVITLIWFSAVLFRIFKVLWPVLEMLEIYNKIKWIFWMYSQIPDVIKDNVKNFIKKK